ncbi:MAG: hypothetical protein FWF46_06485 [Oscillospiraceae bacterium]|nr:hypothetical protein [Oscillospiraceae bacterium]
MINYIKADFYRIFSRKSIYIYFAGILLLYLLSVFITSGTLSADKILSGADNVFLFLAILRRRLFVFNDI